MHGQRWIGHPAGAGHAHQRLEAEAHDVFEAHAELRQRHVIGGPRQLRRREAVELFDVLDDAVDLRPEHLDGDDGIAALHFALANRGVARQGEVSQALSLVLPAAALSEQEAAAMLSLFPFSKAGFLWP